MKTMNERDGDLPKTFAVILASAPPLVIKLGVAYLRTKRKARRSAQDVLKGMVDSGVPLVVAKKLAEDYEARLSLRNIVGIFGPRTWRG